MTETDCLFCRMLASPNRPPLLYEDDLVVAFDMPADHPEKRAPVHFLVIPREHIPSARETEAKHEVTLGRIVMVATDWAVADRRYRVAVKAMALPPAAEACPGPPETPAERPAT